MKEVFKHFSDYHIRRLKNDEKVKSFDCGDNDLNDFIIETLR